MEEIWKDIIGYENYYKVSNLGRVTSVDRTVPHARCGSVVCKGKILSPTISPDGYRLVMLTKYRKQKGFGIHRLMAIAFIPNPNNYPVVNHKDGDKLNNNLDNLEWCTSSYNAKHAHLNGLGYYPKGEAQGNSKLTNQAVVEARQLRADGATWNELASRFGVSRTTINDACCGKTWAHI